MIKDIVSILSAAISVAGFVFLTIRFSSDARERQKKDADRQQADKNDAERRGVEEGRRQECENRMKLSIDSAHNKIRSIEASMAADKQRQSEQFTEMNAKLDNLMTLVSRIESDIVRRLERLEDAS